MSHKATCPACGSHTSAVWLAMEDGTECPYCGLSGAAMIAFEVAAKRGADEALVQRAAKAEARAQTAERKVRWLESLLWQIKNLTSRENDNNEVLS